MIDSFAPVDPALVDVVLPPSGYPVEIQSVDTRDALMSAAGSTSRDFPKSLWIEPKDWAKKARENDEYHTWPMNYVDRYTNQNPTHECTCHSLTRNAEAARNRQRGIIFADGPKKGYRYGESAKGSVWLSPLSVYAEANPGQWGGANVRQVLEIAARRGFLPDKTQPHAYGFKHDLVGTAGQGNTNQSNGSWVRLSQFPDGWQETAKWFKPQEVVFPDSWEQAVCLVLNGIAVSVGRNGHAVPWTFLTFDGDNLKTAGYADSYDVTRYDSLGTIRGCGGNGSFAIVSMTAPDDWMKPAGV